MVVDPASAEAALNFCECAASPWPHIHVNDFVASTLADLDVIRRRDRWRELPPDLARDQLLKEMFGD